MTDTLIQSRAHAKTQLAHRDLLETPHIEIENPHAVPFAVRTRFLSDAGRHGFIPGTNVANSLYVDTDNIDLFRNGITMRLRGRGDMFVKGADRRLEVKKSYPNQFALKKRHPEFYAAAQEIADRLHPGFSTKGIYPAVRDEMEGEYNWPADASELRFSDLPYLNPEYGEGIGIAIESLIERNKIPGVFRTEDLVLKPLVTTNVDRIQVRFYMDANRPFDFFDAWPSSKPTTEMKQSGQYLCMEVSVDQCVSRRPKPGMKIDDILNATGKGLSNFRNLGRSSPFEYEVVEKNCGPKLTDHQAIDTYIRFGIALHEYAAKLCERPALKRSSGVTPMLSKAATAIGFLPECKKGGRLHAAYCAGVSIAP